MILIGLARPGEYDGDVVRLFFSTDPVNDCAGYDVADPCQGLIAIFADQVYEAILTEFAELIFWFGDAIAKPDKDITGLHPDSALIVGHTIE